MKNRFRSNLLLIAVTIVVLCLYEPFGTDRTSSTQRKYNSWLKEMEPTFNVLNKNSLPTLNISLNFSAGTKSDMWQLNLSSEKSDPTHRAKILRILRLVREARIFSHLLSATKTEPVVVFNIKSNNEFFHSALSREDIENNIKIQTLISLFRLYALELSTHQRDSRIASLKD